ncbi:hypothetical protein PHJA_002982700 [Phtheirospermum japonicum]|uniref:PB1 domain-containing protein n=1 Tax=Phtheirospermum japonicum TaxID=374723 RepID=A0A830D9E1_9LAMI|nr:hypothetical protein PHJA_002982700 [Phtheirospermum japonicum]
MDPQPGSASPSPRTRPEAAAWDDNVNPLPPIPGASASSASCAATAATSSPAPRQVPLLRRRRHPHRGGRPPLSLSELHSRLSQTLLNGRHFTLKYQLPAEDLDSLISLATDEDLDNMIEEYDRTAHHPRRRHAAAATLAPPSVSLPFQARNRRLHGLLAGRRQIGDVVRGRAERRRFAPQGSFRNEESSLGNNDKQLVGKSNNAQTQLEVAALDSPPMMETSSSFGSSSSNPSMANLPPIKVRGGEGYMMMAGLDEHFSHVSIVAAAAGVGGENAGRVSCDDEKPDAATGRLRKPPLPLQTVQRKLVDIHNLSSPDSKHAGPHNLPSPDSVASDCSIASPGSLSKHNTIYQDAAQQHMNRDNTNRVNPTPSIDLKTITSNTTQEPTPQVSFQNPADPVPVPVPYPHPHPNQHQQQQQFIHPHNYIHHSYYPMYLHPQTQQPVQHQTDQPYPMYLLPPSNTVPNYPTKPEMGGNIHPGAGSGATPVYVQVPSNQYHQQQQYSNTANYGYEYNPHHHHMADQLYYGRQMAASAPPPQASQYQTMTPAAAVMLTQTSSQMAADSSGQQ